MDLRKLEQAVKENGQIYPNSIQQHVNCEILRFLRGLAIVEDAARVTIGNSHEALLGTERTRINFDVRMDARTFSDLTGICCPSSILRFIQRNMQDPEVAECVQKQGRLVFVLPKKMLLKLARSHREAPLICSYAKKFIEDHGLDKEQA